MSYYLSDYKILYIVIDSSDNAVFAVFSDENKAKKYCAKYEYIHLYIDKSFYNELD